MTLIDSVDIIWHYLFFQFFILLVCLYAQYGISATRRHLRHIFWSSYMPFCVWLTPHVCYSLCLKATLSGILASATGSLRTNKAGAKMIPAISIPILTLPFSPHSIHHTWTLSKLLAKEILFVLHKHYMCSM
jgi:hypothetical protein